MFGPNAAGRLFDGQAAVVKDHIHNLCFVHPARGGLEAPPVRLNRKQRMFELEEEAVVCTVRRRERTREKETAMRAWEGRRRDPETEP